MANPEGFDPGGLVAQALDNARQLGADQADTLVVCSESESVTVRNGETEDIERSEQTDIGLRVIVEQKQAVVSTSKLESSSVRALAGRALAMARAAPPDADTRLPPASAFPTRQPDLSMSDSFAPDVGRLTELALAAEAAAFRVPGVSNSEGAQAVAGSSHVYLANSEGFSGGYEGTVRSLSATAVAGTGQGMERDYEYATSRFSDRLPDADSIGAKAGDRAVARLNARKIDSGVYPVIFAPRVANSLLTHFAGAVNGEAIARGTSFLKDSLGLRLFEKGIEIVDDPLRESGLRSRPFDGEAVATSRLNLVEDGVLQSWLLDCRTARRLKLKSTGHARRSPGGIPSPGASNLYLEGSDIPPEELIGAVGSGLYVTELIGMGVNLVTGDYSRGAAGFWIDKGEIAYPVNEITIAGNLKDMFASLQPAFDLEFRYGVDAPTVLAGSMTVAGG